MRPKSTYFTLLSSIVLFFSTINSGLIAQNGSQSFLPQVLKEAAKSHAPRDLAESELISVYQTPSMGVTHVIIQQKYEDIKVFNGIINAAIKDGVVRSLQSNYITNIDQYIRFKLAGISAMDAMSKGAEHVEFKLPSEMRMIESNTNKSGKPVYYLYEPFEEGLEKPTIELKWVRGAKEKEVKLCWEVTIHDDSKQSLWHIHVDASSGEIVGKYDAIIKCFDDECFDENHLHHHTGTTNDNKSTSAFMPAEMPMSATYRVFDLPLESPNHGARTLVMNPWERNGPGNPAATLMWHNDGTSIYSYTRGNNVYSYEDSLDVDPPFVPSGVPNGNYSPDGGPMLNFDFPLNLANHPRTNIDAAITNAFFWTNLNHDIFYQYGFDEQAGNFQHDNLGRGGLGNDYVRAEALDGFSIGFAGNANFFTPPDGNAPRMQMFLWPYNVVTFTVTAPAIIAGNYNAAESGFSPNNKLANVGPIIGNLVLADDGIISGTPGSSIHDLCEPPTPANAALLNGNIAVIRRGACSFVQKVKNAQNAGAIAAIVINNTVTAPFSMGGFDPTITIPAVMISMADGALIEAQLVIPTTVSVSMSAIGGIHIGDLDNGIITHEIGHGISTRLTGGPQLSSCLGNAEQMGEGWSDYFTLMLTTDWTTAMRNDSRGIGTYALNQPTTGVGIRPFPYSYDMVINPVTYNEVANPAFTQPHGIGSIWASMLWDMTWNIIDIVAAVPDMYHGTGGNNIALQLVIDALKLQNCGPGFVDGRDAILLADELRYNGQFRCAIWNAFARRGLGYGADQGDPNNRFDGVASFVTDTTFLLEKTITPSSIREGEQATIDIEATCGCADINNAMVFDIIPEQLSHVSGGTLSGDTVSFGPFNCLAEEVVNFSFVVEVDSCTYVQAGTVLKDDVEGLDLFAPVQLGGLPNWSKTSMLSNSPSNSWYAQDHSSPSVAALTLKSAIEVSTPMTLSFYHKFETEATWDGGVVEISTNNGTTWVDAEPYFLKNGYTGILQTFLRNGFEGKSDAHFGSSEFIESTITLSPFMGENILIRFLFLSDPFVGGPGINGWYVDDISFDQASTGPNQVFASINGVNVDSLFCLANILLPAESDIVLSCPDKINLSLNGNCRNIVRPDIFINSDQCLNHLVVELVYPPNTNKYDPPNVVDASHMGYELTYSVRNLVNGDRCWGKLVVEDKHPPLILCSNDTISCLMMEEKENEVILGDNCTDIEPQTEILSKKWVDLGCDTNFIGYLARTVRAIDLWGNYHECNDTLFVIREVIDSLVCSDDVLIPCNMQRQLSNGTWVDVLWQTGINGYTYLDAEGYAHPWPTDASGIAPAPYLKSSDPDQPDSYLLPSRSADGPVFENGGKCHIVFKYKDHIIPTCGNAYKIRREWIISDWCQGKDSTCTQWIKITDESPPVVDNRYYTDASVNIQNVEHQLIQDHDLKSVADAHDCKGHVQLEDIRELVERRADNIMYNGKWAKECDDVLTLTFEVEYQDPSHPGKKVVIHGNFDQHDHIYLPVGWHYIVWTITDQCWNQYRIIQKAYVADVTPPVPVCDEITQVTLDPNSCWANIAAQDLDDGSHDNCCQELHYAAASMDSIEYWRTYWHNYAHDCLGEKYYDQHKQVEAQIEEWINCYVFKDTVSLSECGTDSIVLRVYEACGLPVYDPHVFKGSKHQWFCFNLYDEFACWYLIHYEESLHYGYPVPGFECENESFHQEGHLATTCPDLTGTSYNVVSHVPYKYIDIQGTGQFLGMGDDVAFTVDLNVYFPLFGTYYKQLRIASNGYITTALSDNGPDLSNDCPLPSVYSTGSGDRLYPHHDDLDILIGMFAQYFPHSPYPHPNGNTMGSHVIQWVGNHFLGGPVDFQAILFDNGDVIYQYKTTGGEFGAGATVGAQTQDQSRFAEVSCNEAGSIPDQSAVGLSPYGSDFNLSPTCVVSYISEHLPAPNVLLCEYEINPNHPYFDKWQGLKTKYPYLTNIRNSRWYFEHKYNDCMIEVIKDDKTPPVCKAPADVTYYCDGVPYHWIIPVGVDQVQGWGASYAHDVCYESDVIRANCELDKTPVQVWDVQNGGTDKLSKLNGTIANPARWCVATPWDGGEHGYYGGPTDDYYTEDCDSQPWGVTGMVYDYDWKPIYCRVWLLLDQYDLGDASGKPDPKSYFGEVEYSDNCWVDEPTYEDSGSLNECGVGVLTRTWTVKDKCENQSVCYQRVVIKPRSDFEVVFPPDVEVNCNELEGLDPDIAGRPIVSDDDCELIGINYVDERFTITADGCYKILRTWTLIDWCVYDPDQHFRHPDVIVDDRVLAGEDRGCVYRHLKDDGDGYMIYLQVIKVVDEEAPEVTCTAPQVICNYDENCEPEVLELDFGSATDNCALADEIAYRYIIKPGQSEESSEWIYGHGNTHTGALPFGIHDVYLIATDRCGNEDTCTTQVAINDCKRPTPYCYEGIATVVMPSSQSVEVWAKDLDAGSFDNCTEKDNLYFSFDAFGLESSRVFTCADIPDGRMQQIEVEIYVWDEAGNVDKCVTYILLQDGSGNVCADQIIAANPGDKEMGLSMSAQGKVQKSSTDQRGLDIREVTGDVELFQNRPNPFRNETEIGFYLPKSQQVVIWIYNVNGQTVARHEGNYATGNHTWRYRNTHGRAGTGLLYYQLQTETKTITKKMVRVE